MSNSKYKGQPYKSGQRYGKLVSVRPSGKQSPYPYWIFKHDDGTEREYDFRAVRCGKINGKGKDHNKSHGESKTRFYQIWSDVKRRCDNDWHPSYEYYGGKGIKYIWNEYMDFRNDMKESYDELKKEIPENEITLDRIDSDGNYCKENCQWLSRSEHASKDFKRTFYTIDGERRSHNEHAEYYGINSATASNRINQIGMEPEEAFKKPVNKAMSRTKNKEV